jgi:uncharacterized protein YndB with AHSA1/START domain
MAGPDQVGFDHSLRIEAPAAKVLAAFFDPRALAHWWDVATAIATPRMLGVYALEWTSSDARDELLGRFGGVLHGSVLDYQPGRGFLAADCYWLPPDGDPLGPMALEVTCTPTPRKSASGDTLSSTTLHVVQRGIDADSRRWVRYYELLAEGWPPALERMKAYLETGRGVWDLRAYD